MRQLLQNLGDGQTMVHDVPAPGPQRGALLIRTTRSLISAGTERMLVDFGKAGWIGKARQQPEKVRAVLNKMRATGLVETLRAVRSKLSQPIPLGYCQAGIVVATGDHGEIASPGGFRVGERVVSNGPHAEVVTVSHHLCARIPDGVSDEAATFTPLASIALEGIHLLVPQPGEKVVVTGLGLIGQLAVRILRAMGCEVLGVDPSAERRALAERSGAACAVGDPVTAALSWTSGKGVAGVLITASTSSNEVVNQAARSCRRRGKVVLVGVVGLQLNRADFYRNEISFQVSCSYGTRDGQGEHSARRNFEQVLGWMAAGQLPVEDMITHRFDFGDAPKAYGALADRSSLGISLRYREAAPEVLSRTLAVSLSRVSSVTGVGVVVIGAGNFALRTLLPALRSLDRPVRVESVVSRQGAAAWMGAQAAGARQASTDATVALADPAVQVVIVTTRHNAHAREAIAALQAGKHVWVEKPLCLTLEELAQIEAALADARLPSSAPRPPILMVGFNRRFAPIAVALRSALTARPAARRFVVTVNAGRLDPDHWTLDPTVGGGRIVGEGCHFVDLLRFLAGTAIVSVRCVRRDSDGQDGGAFELSFADGSSALLDYRTDLPAHHPKETIEVTGANGEFAVIENWARLRTRGLGGLGIGHPFSRAPRKGHREALQAFFAAIAAEGPVIPLDEILEVSRWAIVMQEMEEGGTKGTSAHAGG